VRGLLCAAAAALVAAAAPGASLELSRMHPVTVEGTGFHTRERVRVVLHDDSGRHRRRARADASGAFSTAFKGVVVGRCEAFSVTAVGRAGSRARVGRRAPVGCPP
jgi:hypothetical protein